MMRLRAGQEWELPSAGNDDPLLLRVVEVMNDGYAVVHTVRRSAPNAVLDRSTMHPRDVVDAGILVAGPGAVGAIQRRERVARHRDLIRYAARRSAAPVVDGQLRFDARELIALVGTDEKVSRDDARAMLREALAELGGTETWAPSNDWRATRNREIYVLPVRAFDQAA